MVIKNDCTYDENRFTGKVWRAYTEDGTEMSHAHLRIRESRFHGEYINILTFGGIGTSPEYRRQHCVRTMFEQELPKGREYGAALALLHPFSFSYYRKFGFERIYDTVQAIMPIKALDFVERYPDLVPYTEEKQEELLRLFDAFSKNRNIMFRRYDEKLFLRNDQKLYLHYDNAHTLTGYIAYEPKNHYDGINRMVSDELYVKEIGFLNRETLLHLLGFLRMYEGELEMVRFHDITPTPELDMLLKHNMDTKYDVHPDIMGRVLDTEAALKLVKYPDRKGTFTLHVDDWLENVRGNYRVEYENGTCEVTRLDEDAECEVCLSETAFVRFLYGTDAYTPEIAIYMDGVSLNGKAEDFFRAFPKRINGLYEHF